MPSVLRPILIVSGLVAALVCAGGCGAERASRHEPCCVDGASQCDYARCGSGLTCYVLPGAMYVDVGICCTSASCTLPCDVSDCDGSCDDAEAGCPPQLTCRNANTSAYCLP